jgi:hypothetical protein
MDSATRVILGFTSTAYEKDTRQRGLVFPFRRIAFPICSVSSAFIVYRKTLGWFLSSHGGALLERAVLCESGERVVPPGGIFVPPCACLFLSSARPHTPMKGEKIILCSDRCHFNVFEKDSLACGMPHKPRLCNVKTKHIHKPSYRPPPLPHTRAYPPTVN